MQFGIFSVGDVTTDPATGRTPTDHERIRADRRDARLADEGGSGGGTPVAHRRGGGGAALLPDGRRTPTSRRRVRAGHSLRGTAETGEVGTSRVVLADAEQMRTPRGSSRGKANA